MGPQAPGSRSPTVSGLWEMASRTVPARQGLLCLRGPQEVLPAFPLFLPGARRTLFFSGHTSGLGDRHFQLRVAPGAPEPEGSASWGLGRRERVTQRLLVFPGPLQDWPSGGCEMLRWAVPCGWRLEDRCIYGAEVGSEPRWRPPGKKDTVCEMRT